MRRLEVVYAVDAAEDLEALFQYLRGNGASLRTTEGYIARIRNRCARIGDAPSSGRLRDDLRLGLRTIAFERRVVIAYTIEADHVVVLRVFYGGRDVDALLGDSQG
jgi:toxin ParE1/3/4